MRTCLQNSGLRHPSLRQRILIIARAQAREMCPRVTCQNLFLLCFIINLIWIAVEHFLLQECRESNQSGLKCQARVRDEGVFLKNNAIQLDTLPPFENKTHLIHDSSLKVIYVFLFLTFKEKQFVNEFGLLTKSRKIDQSAKCLPCKHEGQS